SARDFPHGGRQHSPATTTKSDAALAAAGRPMSTFIPREAAMRRLLLTAICVLAALGAGIQPQRLRADGKRQSIIVHCPGWCHAVAGSIRNMGGDVSFEYENVEAIAASVPEERLAQVSALVGAQAVWKDTIVAQPAPVGAVSRNPVRGAAVATLDA